MTDFTFLVEMGAGQPRRQVDADSFAVREGWLVFYRNGEEYWRANTAVVTSMETKRTLRGDEPIRARTALTKEVL
jgi:hypothetical protein